MSQKKVGHKTRIIILSFCISVFILGGCSNTKEKSHELKDRNTIPPLDSAPAIISGQVVNIPNQIQYVSVDFSRLPDWSKQNFTNSLQSFKNSCIKLNVMPQWYQVCQKANAIDPNNLALVKYFFEREFTPWMVKAKGNPAGIVTGYYEPAISGSFQRTKQARFPIYGVPNDFISVNLPPHLISQKGYIRVQQTGANTGLITSNGPYTADLNQFPITAKTRAIKGRIVGQNFVPYYTRAEIYSGAIDGKTPILAYADDPVELFFLQIQGSGRLLTPDGQSIRLAYADKTEHPYRSVGQYMAQKGYLPLNATTMQGIKSWINQNPHRLFEVLSYNPSFIFFQSQPNNHDKGPEGALGVPLMAEYSAAIDRHYFTLGSPLFVATTHPANGSALNRLVMAQDTGSAITGSIRVDFFWGYGYEAGQIAGKMKHTGYVWTLLPNGVKPSYQP